MLLAVDLLNRALKRHRRSLESEPEHRGDENDAIVGNPEPTPCIEQAAQHPHLRGQGTGTPEHRNPAGRVPSLGLTTGNALITTDPAELAAYAEHEPADDGAFADLGAGLAFDVDDDGHIEDAARARRPAARWPDTGALSRGLGVCPDLLRPQRNLSLAVKARHIANLAYLLDDLPGWEDAMIRELSAPRFADGNFIRVHDSGDFSMMPTPWRGAA